MSARPHAGPMAMAPGDARVTVSRTAAELEAALARARAARDRVLAEATNDDVVGALATTAARWSDPALPARASVVDELARALAIAPQMLARCLDNTFSVVTADSLGALIAAEAQSPPALERAIARPDGTRARLLGPPVVVHLLAGNVTGLAIAPIVACLLARSVCVVRDSSRQPLLTAAFVETLADLAPELADMVVVAGWAHSERAAGVSAAEDIARGGGSPTGEGSEHAAATAPAHDVMEVERVLAADADRVEISGGDATVAMLAARYPAGSVVERGSRLSVALVGAGVSPERWAGALAEDMVLHEGLGCLSPHTIIVEGDDHARAVAHALAGELDRTELRWPRRARSVELEASRRAFIGAAEMSSLARSDEMLLRGSDDAWCVHVCQGARPATGPGLRCITIVPADDREGALRLLQRTDVALAGVGLALDDPAHARDELVDRLRELGATLVCAAGEMQRPPIAWQQDGRRRLGDLLAWHEVGA